MSSSVAPLYENLVFTLEELETIISALRIVGTLPPGQGKLSHVGRSFSVLDSSPFKELLSKVTPFFSAPPIHVGMQVLEKEDTVPPLSAEQGHIIIGSPIMEPTLLFPYCLYKTDFNALGPLGILPADISKATQAGLKSGIALVISLSP